MSNEKMSLNAETLGNDGISADAGTTRITQTLGASIVESESQLR